MSRNDNWPQLILHYRTRHGLTQTEFADRLKVTQQTVSRWESGKQTPDPEAQQLLRSVIGLTALATKSAWQQRVALSWGVEALFEKGWRCVAGSERLHALVGQAQDNLAGKTLSDVPAEKNYVAMFDKAPFFDGGVRVLKARLEVRSNGSPPASAQVDFWPVLTSGDEIVCHAVVYASAPPEVPKPGVLRLCDIQAVMLDGRVVALEGEET